MENSELTPVHIARVEWDQAQDALKSLRYRVFVEEQQVPEDLEWDGLDNTCWHFVATDQSGTAIGTTRLVPTGQIGRMAVLITHRRQGIGAQLLAAAICMARELNFDQTFLHAQTHAIEFYQQAGFATAGEEFDEAGITHILMQKNLQNIKV
ncbi:MAG: GNAT family N-acetyltransferase [Gammaproteobacteria bacterium]|jgi:predicted GNAT family N-acyltransferase|nr:GNAT family N-acetyltransferase [Gammaproteobacteria bacterium]MBT5205113.1 GNAT family N-acetyltransferase [Gammaproteobacteria bacterium]MBT5604114.1 GNAT family N-acetyltransferase [Gammaproteobacteria bacterium]MBT6246474.1 GNAT family N-acetyltransferase [Gammaproteobacteria bacterium]